MAYFYTFYVATKTTNTLTIDVRDEGFTAQEWDYLSDSEQEAALQDMFSEYVSSLADQGFYPATPDEIAQTGLSLDQ